MALVAEPAAAPTPTPPSSGRRLSPGARYALGRIGSAFATLAFVLVFNFFLFRVLPGDPVRMMTRGKNVDPDQYAALVASLRKPLPEQFVAYLKNPLGIGVDSVQFSRPVWEVIGPTVFPTLALVGSATILASLLGVWLGIRTGWRRGSKLDKRVTNTTLVLYSMPEFWFGMILLIVFANGVLFLPGIFPTSGLIDPTLDPNSVAGILSRIWHLVLPVTTLTVIYLAEYSLVMRASLIDETRQDYLNTARAKGLRDDDVRRRHAVPNALLPTMTLIFLNLGFIVGGAVTIEYVFSIPGLGQLTVQALQFPDIPLLQALFLLFSIAVILANLVADLLYARLDPRVRV